MFQTQKSGKYLNMTRTSQGNSNAPTKRFFLKMPVRLAPWTGKKEWHASPLPQSQARSGRERERERERERARARARYRESERERERDGGEPPRAGSPKTRKQTLRKNLFRELFCKITKTNFTKINSWRIIYGKLRVRHVVPENNYAK